MAMNVMLKPATRMNAMVSQVIIMSSSRAPDCFHQIDDFDARQIGGRLRRDTHGLRLAGFFQERSHLSCVGPVLRAGSFRDPWFDSCREIIGQAEMLSGRHASKDFAEVIGIVARKV